MGKLALDDITEMVARECAISGVTLQEFSDYLQEYCKALRGRPTEIIENGLHRMNIPDKK